MGSSMPFGFRPKRLEQVMGMWPRVDLDFPVIATLPGRVVAIERMKNDVGDNRILRVASVQFESAPGDKEANFRKIEAFVERAAQQNARLIIFPECCITGYWFIRNLSVKALMQMAEPIFDGPSSQRLIELAKRSGMTIGAGLVEAGPSGEFYNSYV